ncbi:MAG: 3'(2'),5'-bisphosphate nucleotidase CysQ [Myxococcaceae bacterium]
MLEIELTIAEALARQAGKTALSLQHLGALRYKDNFEGPVSQGDLVADQLIREGLQKHFPDDFVITEETYVPGAEIPSTGRVWFVDPIDGTIDYVAGGTEYSVMIGLAINGIPQLGVVFEPATQTLWKAKPELAERIDSNGQVHKLDIRANSVPDTGPVLAMSHSHPSLFVDFLAKNLPVSKIIKKSSVGLKIALITDGLADVYMTSARRIKLWDTCAPAAILNASGGALKSIHGQTLFFGGSIQHGIEIIATTPHAEIWLSGRIQRVIEKWITLGKTRKHSS